MSDRTKNIIMQLAQGCVQRNENCPDYGGKGQKAAHMALNYFTGAAMLAKLTGDQELFDHLQSICVWSISIRGMEEVRRLAKPDDKSAAQAV